MSDKDRQKNGHERTDKKNKSMRESENRRRQEAPPRQPKEQANMTNSEPGAQGPR